MKKIFDICKIYFQLCKIQFHWYIIELHFHKIELKKGIVKKINVHQPVFQLFLRDAQNFLIQQEPSKRKLQTHSGGLGL